VLAEADVVMLVGARLNWLLSHGKGKTWGAGDSKAPATKQFIQVDISPTEADSNVAIQAPVIGDIGSCLAAMNQAIGSGFPSRRPTGPAPSPNARTRTSPRWPRRWRRTLRR
jgi:oxalyl-CoA decarboxylase